MTISALMIPTLDHAPVIVTTIVLASLLACYTVYAVYWQTDHVQEELAVFGTPRKSGSGPRLGTVVICGGGIGGISAARACCDHFERVILVEPEFSKTLSGKAKTRVMQYNSIHAYLVIFAEGLRRLWPTTFEQRAKDVGAFFLSGDYFFHIGGVYTAVENKGYPHSVSMRRKVLEPLLHRLLVDDSPQVKGRLEIVEGLVRGIERNELDGTKVGGVYGKTNEGVEFRFEGVDFVIDSTGSTQCGLKWLEAARLPTPQRVSYNPNLRYMTITFTVSKDLGALLPVPGGYEKATWLYSFIGDPNAAFIFGKMDNGMIQLCITSWGLNNLPKKPEEIEPFLRALTSPVPIPDWVPETARLLAEDGAPDFYPAKINGFSHVHYHETKGLPDNFIALGDAVMQLNPLFGQGCGKAMVGVMLFDSMLRECTSGKIGPGFSKRFFKIYEERLRSIWEISKAVDYAHPTTQPIPGETLDKYNFTLKAAGLITAVGRVDSYIALKVWAARQLVESESTALSPVFFLRVVWAQLRRVLGLWRDDVPLTVQVCHTTQ